MKLPEELIRLYELDQDDQKRIKIFEACIKVFGEKGIHKTKIADIAKEAGIGKGTVYEYFKSKDEILAYTYYKMVIMSHHFIPEHIDPGKSAVENLIQYLNGAVRFFAILPKEVAMAYMGLFLESFFHEKTDMITYMEKLGLPIADFQKRYLNYINDVYRLGKKSGDWGDLTEAEFFGLLVNYIQGMKIMYFFSEMQFPVPSPELFTDILVNGAKKEKK